MAILTLLSGFVTLLLPETHNKPLLDRLELTETNTKSRANDHVQEPEVFAVEEEVHLYETSV